MDNTSERSSSNSGIKLDKNSYNFTVQDNSRVMQEASHSGLSGVNLLGVEKNHSGDSGNGKIKSTNQDVGSRHKHGQRL